MNKYVLILYDFGIICFGFNIFGIYIYKATCIDFRGLICCKQGEILYGTNLFTQKMLKRHVYTLVKIVSINMLDKVTSMNMKKKLYVRLLHEKEEGHMHVNYNDEYNYYQIVANGDIFSVKKILINPENINIYNKSEYGQLSRNNLRNIRYHFIVAVALITRACVERGLNREFAYTLSDLYIERMDSLNTPQQILSLYNDMLINFCQEMMEIKKGGYSLPVVKIIEFVEDHINENISIEMIADSLRYNRCYLSTVFKKETGTTIKEFICDEKIKATVDLLRFSNYTCLEISELFHFASQSYYIKCFKNKFGCTPNEYRKQYLRK